MESNEQKLNALQEREREILKKITVASRAGASQQIIGQLYYLLEECKAQQMEIQQLKNLNKKDSNFDDYLSIG